MRTTRRAAAIRAKPEAWRDQRWQVKNLFELKNARRVLFESNLIENNWLDAQAGYAIVLTPRNQDGACTWCTVEDVTMRGNLVRRSGGAISILGTDNSHPSGTARRFRIEDNLFVDDDSEEADRLRDPSHVRNYNEDEWRQFSTAVEAVLA